MTVVIEEILPHREPFLLIDEVLEVTPGVGAVARKTVRADEWYLSGHFPDRPIMPGVLIIEAMAQAAGILGFNMMGVKPSDGVLYFFVGSDKLRFRRPVVPGDQLMLEASFLSSKRSIWKFACRATVDGKEVCSAEIICAEQKV